MTTHEQISNLNRVRHQENKKITKLIFTLLFPRKTSIFSLKNYLLSLGIRGVQTRPTPTKSTKPPNPHRILARTDAPANRLRVSKTQRRRVEWRVFFSKTRVTRPDQCYIQIQPTLARSSLDSRRSGKISTVFGKIKIRFKEI